jgi:putative membrane protein
MKARLTVAVAAGVAVLGAGSAQAVVPGVSAQDENYLQTSAAGDSFEIKGAELALQRSHNPQVRDLAKILRRDHTRSLHETKALARRLHAPRVQNKPTPSQSWELRQLQAKSGADFDRQYADLEVNDHHQDIEENKWEKDHGLNAAVVAEAKKEIPMLAEHLKASRTALKSARGS